MPKPVTLLVEGKSGKAAVVTVLPRFGIDLEAEGITVTVINGAGNFGRAIPEAVALGHRVGGMYDEAEEHFIADALNRQHGEDLTRQGFFACRPDLELELVRAIGAVEMAPLLESHGGLKTFRNFQDQPKYKDAYTVEQLRRYIGANGARKAKYAAIMADAVDFGSVPEPLEGIVNRLRRPGRELTEVSAGDASGPSPRSWRGAEPLGPAPRRRLVVNDVRGACGSSGGLGRRGSHLSG